MQKKFKKKTAVNKEQIGFLIIILILNIYIKSPVLSMAKHTLLLYLP